MNRRSFVQFLAGVFGFFLTWIGAGKVAKSADAAISRSIESGRHNGTHQTSDDFCEYYVISEHYLRRQYTKDRDYAVVLFDRDGDLHTHSSGRVEPKILVFHSIENPERMIYTARVRGMLLGRYAGANPQLELREFRKIVMKKFEAARAV